MKYSKGFIGIGIIIAIVAALVVGGGAVYFATKTPTPPKNIEENNYQPQANQNPLVNGNNNQVENTTTTNTTVKENQPNTSYEIKNIKEFISTKDNNGPSWSPDGKWIAFSTTNHAGIYIKNLNNNIQKLITNDSGSGFRYSWSPDSKEIVYLSRETINGNANNTIKLVEVENGKITELTTGGIGASMPNFTSTNEVIYSYKGTLIKRKWNGTSVGAEEIIAKNVPANIITSSPSGNKLIVENDEGINIMDSTGGNIKTIVENDEGFSSNAKVSFDNSKVLYKNNNLFVYDINSQKITDLGKGQSAQWLPSGKIIYCISGDNGMIITDSEIYIINADGSNKTKITNTTDQIETDIAVSPDGKLIVYRDEKSGKIYIGELK